jgi:uncharacterized protein YceK
MKWARIALFAAMVPALPSGCGTICNFAHSDPEIYGGVQNDVAVIMTPQTGGSSGGGQGMAIFAGLVVADVCCSAVADTLTLPLAIRLRQNKPTSEDASTDKGKPIAPPDASANAQLLSPIPLTPSTP